MTSIFALFRNRKGRGSAPAIWRVERGKKRISNIIDGQKDGDGDSGQGGRGGQVMIGTTKTAGRDEVSLQSQRPQEAWQDSQTNRSVDSNVFLERHIRNLDRFSTQSLSPDEPESREKKMAIRPEREKREK
jgi:hypothetical protein